MLRQCCGAVQDLAEIAGGIQPLGIDGSVPPEAPAPAAPVRGGAAAPVAKEEKVAKEKKKDKKKSSKKEKKASERERTPSETRAYRAAAKAEVKEETRGSDTGPLAESGALGEASEEEDHEKDDEVCPGGPAGSAGPIRRRNVAEERRYIEELRDANPAEREDDYPEARGSVKRHFERSGGGRPPEPDHPPPGREDSPEPLVRRRVDRARGRGNNRRDRSRSRKKAKGRKHRERGRNYCRPHWNQPWRQKPRRG